MFIIDQMLQKLERLKITFAGKRIGVFPSDYGRFDQSIAELLEGMDVVGIYLPCDNMNDQGLTPWYSRETFLLSIDVCLCFGTQKEDYALCTWAAKKRYPVEFVFLFDEEDPFCILLPDVPPDDWKLGCAAETESAHVRAFLEYESRSFRQIYCDAVDSPYQTTLARQGCVSFVCPDCGKKCTSSHSFVVISEQAYPFIFHPFDCCREFYLVSAPLRHNSAAIYFPQKEQVIILDLAFRAFVPHKKKLFLAISLFKLLSFQHRALVRQYLNNETVASYGIVGAMNNIGHGIVHEANALLRFYTPEATLKDFIATNEKMAAIMQLFLDDSGHKVVAGDDKRKAALLFSEPLHLQYICFFPFSPTPLVPAVRLRAQEKARELCRARIQHSMKKAQSAGPIIMMTLRASRRQFWKGQQEAIPWIMNTIHEQYPDVGVVFDGFLRDGTYNLYDLLENIKEQLHEDIAVFEALDCSIAESVTWAGLSSVYLGVIGSGTAFAALTNLPMVLFGAEGQVGSSMWRKNDRWCIGGTGTSSSPILLVPCVSEEIEKGMPLVEPDREKIVEAILSLVL